MNTLLRVNKKILAVLVIVVLLFFVFGLIMLFQKKTPATAISTASYTPALGALKISPFAKIGVVFSRDATLEDEKNISLTISPKSNNSVLWSSDKKSIYFTTNNPLALSTQYQVSLTVSGYKFTWYFTTASGSELSQADQAKLQGMSDSRFSQSEQAFNNKYPWYKKLPPENNDYFILFNNTTNTFFIYIYPKTNSAIPQSAQITSLENEATQELKNIGVDLSLYKISWQMSP